MFIYESNVSEKACDAVKKLDSDIPCIVFGNDQKRREELSYHDLFALDEVAPSYISPETIGLIIYTSGTTGLPKGVLLSHDNMMSMISMINEWLLLTEEDRSYLTLPLFHVNAIMISLLSMLQQTGSVVLKKRFDIKAFLPDIDQYQPTYTSGVPTVYHKLCQLPEGENQYDLQSVRFGICGAAPVSVKLFEKFESRFPFQLIEGWGLSEGTTASTLNPLGRKRKVGSIGLPLPGQKVRVVDENGIFLPPKQIGELIIKGPNVMQGYVNNEEETKKTIRDGWLYTGDLGYYDEEGYFFIVDRKKELIIRGGMNVYPKQIEEVLYQLPDVIETAVIGIPDEEYGEEVKAFVVLNNSSTLTEKEIIAHCQKKLANFQCPKKVEMMDELPKNSIGKITKFALKQR